MFFLDWNFIIKTIGPKLFKFFAFSFDRPEVCSDLVQETLIRLFRKVEQGVYQEKEGSLLSFAYGIAHFIKLEYLAQNKLSWNQKHLTDNEPDTFPSQEFNPEEKLLLNEKLKNLKSAIQQLSDAESSVLNFYIEQDLGMREIGEILNMPEGTVKSHLSRAKTKLKELL